MSETPDQMETPVVSIIVISYNTCEMTLDCLRSIAAETRIPHEVIVLDNASSDGSAEAIAVAFPKIKLLAERTNHGFAQGNNIAIRQARGNYVLLLNPDTVVLDSAIDNLLDFAHRTPDAGIWGGRTLYGDHSLNPTNCWRRMTLWSLTSQVLGLSSMFRSSPLLNPEGYGGWQRDEEREVDIITGCFLLIRKNFWDKLGGFDAAYVMYGEEADLCLRARAFGARPRFTPKAGIIHYVGASERVRADRLVRLITAKMTLVRHHFPTWQKPLGMVMLRLWPWSRMLAARYLSRVTRRPRHRTAAENWTEVWARRGEWRAGYPETSQKSGRR